MLAAAVRVHQQGIVVVVLMGMVMIALVVVVCMAMIIVGMVVVIRVHVRRGHDDDARAHHRRTHD